MKTLQRLLLCLLVGFAATARAQNLPEQQCTGAIPVGQISYSQPNSYSGFGITQELNTTNRGCLQQGERNDVWYTINVSSSGVLVFSISPLGLCDYDFGLWNITGGGCQTLYNGLLPIRCNFSGGQNGTGISTASGNPNYGPALNVNAGETYVLNVSNFSSNQTGYFLSFAGSTASIFDTIPPRISATSTTCGVSSDTVRILMSEPVLCSSIAANGSDFQITPAVPGVSILSASAPSCANSGVSALTINLKLSAPLPNGTYTLTSALGTDGNTLLDNFNNALLVGDTVSFTIGTPPPPIYTLLSPAPCGKKGLFSITPPVPGIYTLAIKQGTTTLHSFSNVSGQQVDSLLPGSYTATLTNAGCSSTVAFTVLPTRPTVTFSVTPTCAGSSSGSVSVAITGASGPWTYSWNTTPVRTNDTITHLAAGNYILTANNGAGCLFTDTAMVTSVPGFPLTLTQTNVSCHSGSDGTATATPAGGTGPYTYAWNSSPNQLTATATGLSAGVYSVGVKDVTGCISTAGISITQPPELSAAATATPALCGGGTGGTATATASGGTGPYTFSWNSTPVQTTATATGLAAGTYTVTVTDAKNCTKIKTATVTQPPALTATTTATAATCAVAANGTATVTGGSGVLPYTYSWNTTPAQTTRTATGLLPGPYNVTLTDATGCTKTVSVTIPVGAGIGGSFTRKTPPNCFGGATGSAVYTPTGGASPYSYAWSNGQTVQTATGLAAGFYSVTATDANGCARSDTFTLSQPTALSTTVAADSVSCFGGANGRAIATATGGTAPYTYSWNTTPTQATAIATGLSTGSYTVTVTDAKGCTDTGTTTIDQPTALSMTTGVQRASCPGLINGKAYAVPSGGVGPYSYRWNTTPVQTTDTAFNLLPLSYTVTVKDSKNCSLAQSVAVPGFVLTTTTTSASCNGVADGSATVTPAAGIAPYSYAWNTTPVQTDSVAVNLPAGTYTASVTDAGGCTITKNAVVTSPAAIVLTPTITAATCAGAMNGKASVAVTGGRSPYSYSWNTTPVKTTAAVTGLAVGAYSVTVTDANNCVATLPVGIPAGPGISGSFTRQTQPGCFGQTNGSAVFTPTGGTNPYTYLWSNGQATATATGLSAGTYSIATTDANGCSRNDTFTLAQPAALQATAQADSVSCFGGANGRIVATASGGTAPYTYRWNTLPAQTSATATGLSAGARRVTVTDAKSCTTTAADTVRQPSAIAVATGVQRASCPGLINGKAFATPSGGTPPYTYSWNTTPVQTGDTANSLLPGPYTVTVTDRKGCTSLQTVNVPGFTLTLTQTNVLCNGGTNGSARVTASGGIAPYTYSWNTTPVQTTATATNLGAGNYIAAVTDAGGCTLNAPVIITAPLLLTATNTVTAATCLGASNGTAAITVAGGTAPYTYRWNTTPVKTTAAITGLATGAYVATVKDANNCTATFNITVPVGAGFSGSFTNVVSPRCFGSTSGAATFAPAGGNTPYAYLWSNGQTSSRATNLAAGSWSVRVTDVSGCLHFDTVTLTQPTALGATIQTTNVACFGGTGGTAAVTVSGGTPPYTYSWNTLPARTTATATGLSAGNYTVAITDSKGCTLNQTAAITQPAVLSATTGTQATLCPGGASGKAWVTALGGTAPYTYRWNTTPLQTTDTARGLLAGAYTALVTDNKGCNATRVVNVTNAIFTIAVTKTNARCFNASNGTATVTVTGGRAPYSYAWSSGQATATVSSLGAGTYTVTVIDANGCVKTATTTLTQPTALTAAATPNNPRCFGSANGSVALAVSGGTAPYSYLWSNGQTSATATNLAAGNWSVQVTDSKGCTYNTAGALTQPTALQGTVQSTNASCNGSTDGTASATVSGGSAPYTYSWSTSPVRTTQTATGLSAGTYRLMVRDVQNCVALYTATLSQPAPIRIAVQTYQASCTGAANGKAVAIPTGGTPPYTYSWSSGQTVDSATGLLPGSYSVTVTDSKGCTGTQNVTVGAAAGVRAIVAIGKTPCVGATDGTLNGLASNGVAPYVFSWNTTPVQATQTATNLTSSAYLLTVTDASGCVDTETAVLPNLPLPVVSAGGNKTVCVGKPVQLAGNGTAVSWLWTPATALSCTACISPVCTPTTDRRYLLTGTGANGCVNTDTAWVRVTRRAPVSVGATQKICLGNPATLTANGGDVYSWTPVATVNNTTDSSTFAHPDTTTNYRVIIGQNNCFQDTLYQWVEVYTTPVISMPKEIPALYNTKVRLSAMVENGPFLQWAPAGNLDCDACAAPVALVTGSLTYVLTASNAGGCEATGYVDIVTNCDPKNYFIPTGFTPDGDGENRWFFPKSKDPGIMRSMKIFNRWGKLVFEARGIPFNSAQVGWDGTHQGQPAPQGVYVYIIEAECFGGQVVQMQGDVTLLR